MRNCLSFLILSFLPVLCFCQKEDAAVLLDTGILFIKPDKFYIYDVIDSRSDKTLNNFHISSTDKKGEKWEFSLDKALMQVFTKGVQKDTSLLPVIIEIRELAIVPKKDTAWPKDELKIEFRYKTLLDNKNVDFAFYTLSQNAYKYMKNPEYLAKLLSKELPESVKQLNQLVNNTYNNFPYKGVKLLTTIYLPTKNTDDTVCYNATKRISAKDFTGIPDTKVKATAVSATSFEYNAGDVIKDGYKTISVVVKCYFIKSGSWIKEEMYTEHVLAHEQLHFDITWLWALKFVKTLKQMKLPVEEWQHEIDNLYESDFEEMSAMQKEYDQQSDHGRKDRMQSLWKKKIDLLIKENLL